MEIDGSILEGGGQILRNSMAYSVLTYKPIKIYNIRGKRSKPGLQNQHLTGVLLLTSFSNGKTKGAEKNSTEITFTPGPNVDGTSKKVISAEIPSAGACTLLIQAVLPVALFVPQKSTFKFVGGTHVPFSPSFEYTSHVFLETLKQFNPTLSIHLRLEKHGFMPNGGGDLSMTIEPMKTLQPIVVMEKGVLEDCVIHFSGYVSDDFVTDIINELEKSSSLMVPLIYKRNTVQTEQPPPYTKFSVTAVLRFEKSLQGITLSTGRNSTSKRLVSILVNKINRILSSKGVVDKFLQDQLILYMALADGESSIRCDKSLTLHTKTAIHFAQLFTGVQFSVLEEDDTTVIHCKGISYYNHAFS